MGRLFIPRHILSHRWNEFLIADTIIPFQWLGANTGDEMLVMIWKALHVTPSIPWVKFNLPTLNQHHQHLQCLMLLTSVIGKTLHHKFLQPSNEKVMIQSHKIHLPPTKWLWAFILCVIQSLPTFSQFHISSF